MKIDQFNAALPVNRDLQNTHALITSIKAIRDGLKQYAIKKVVIITEEGKATDYEGFEAEFSQELIELMLNQKRIELKELELKLASI
jgi:hypothetical protein